MPTTLPVSIMSIEERAYRAWPALNTADQDGWILRHTPQTKARRSNSAYGFGPHCNRDPDHVIEPIEEFYKQNNYPVRYQVPDTPEFSNFDQALNDRGYVIEAPVHVQWAELQIVGGACEDPAEQPVLLDHLTAPWRAVFCQTQSDKQDAIGRLSVIERIGEQCALVHVCEDGIPVAVGLGVYDDDWTGIFCMQTLPDYRQKGYAGSVIKSLADWTLTLGGHYMYLQVETDNPKALSLYAKYGFEHAYDYHYRTLK